MADTHAQGGLAIGFTGRGLERRINVVNGRPILRVAAAIILAFCCATPLVWLFSNLIAYGLHSFL
jgi:hypothetical protein